MKEKEKEEIEFVYSPNFLILAHRQETVQQVFPSGCALVFYRWRGSLSWAHSLVPVCPSPLLLHRTISWSALIQYPEMITLGNNDSSHSLLRWTQEAEFYYWINCFILLQKTILWKKMWYLCHQLLMTDSKFSLKHLFNVMHSNPNYI